MSEVCHLHSFNLSADYVIIVVLVCKLYILCNGIAICGDSNVCYVVFCQWSLSCMVNFWLSVLSPSVIVQFNSVVTYLSWASCLLAVKVALSNSDFTLCCLQFCCCWKGEGFLYLNILGHGKTMLYFKAFELEISCCKRLKCQLIIIIIIIITIMMIRQFIRCHNMSMCFQCDDAVLFAICRNSRSETWWQIWNLLARKLPISSCKAWCILYYCWTMIMFN